MTEPWATRDVRLLFGSRTARMFGFGAVSVSLALYLSVLGFDALKIGWLLTLALAGDLLVSYWMTTNADRLGRRRMLAISAALMFGAGLLFVLSGNYWLLLAAAIVGVISPSGNEIGPALALEQASLAELAPPRGRTQLFAWYNLAGSAATAAGALVGGLLVQRLLEREAASLPAYRLVFGGYCLLAVILLVLAAALSPAVEPRREHIAAPGRMGLNQSRRVVLNLSSLFALDALGGGLVVQSMLAFWFNQRFGASPGALGAIFFGANLLAAASALSAGWVAARIGLVRTMVFTHLPSNVLLVLLPFAPTLWLATLLLLLRFSISQMDVPTRQSYVMAIVESEERSAAAGVTGIARSLGAMFGPALAGFLTQSLGWFAAPFVLGGSLKIVYDLLLYRRFAHLRPPEER